MFVRKFPEAYALPPRRSLLLSSMIPYLYADLPFIRVHQRAPWDTAPYVALMKNGPFPLCPSPTPSFHLYAPLLTLFIRTCP